MGPAEFILTATASKIMILCGPSIGVWCDGMGAEKLDGGAFFPLFKERSLFSKVEAHMANIANTDFSS